MLQAVRCSVGLRAALSKALPPPRLANAAAAHRCLAHAPATGASKGRTDPAATVVAVASDPHGTQQAAAGAGAGSTPVETDEMGNPRHILLYEGSKVGRNVVQYCKATAENDTTIRNMIILARSSCAPEALDPKHVRHVETCSGTQSIQE